MVYADYDYYSNVYLGTAISSDDFPRLAMRASAFLDYATMGRVAKHADWDAVKLACCAVADDYQTIETAKALANTKTIVSLPDAGPHPANREAGIASIARDSSTVNNFFMIVTPLTE